MNTNLDVVFGYLDQVSSLFIVPETIGIGEREYDIDYTKGVINSTTLGVDPITGEKKTVLLVQE